MIFIKIIEYISYLMIPVMIGGIILYGVIKKQKVYDDFANGAIEGAKVVIKIFPTMLAIIVALNLFRESGAMDIVIKVLSPFSHLVRIPTEIVPIGIMRSLSGGASLGLLTDILKTHGADSMLGNIASTVLGATETTIYVIAIYASTIKLKNTKCTLMISLFCDFVCLCVASWIWQSGIM